MDERIEKNGNIFANNFAELGMPVIFVNGIESPVGETYFFNMQNVAQYNKRYLTSMLEKMSVYHHADISLLETKVTHFAIFVKNLNNTTLSLTRCMYDCNYQDIVIGLDNTGELVKVDFKSIPHLLIAGATGAGKSVLLHNLIVNLLQHYTKDKLQMVIIDPKGTELTEYSDVANTTFISTTDKAIASLKSVERIMDDRYARGNHYEHELFVIIDELADLMLTSKYEVEASIVRIAQKGRACGIHLIVATQRPSCDVVSGLIKANMPYRIILKTASVRDSVVCIDHKGCEKLQVGEAIVKLGINEKLTKIAWCEPTLKHKLISKMS